MHRNYARTYLKQWESHSVFYKLTLRISDKQLASILANAIAADGEVLGCEVLLNLDMPEGRRRRRREPYTNPHIAPGLEEVVMNVLADGQPHSLAELENIFQIRGKSPKSVSPTVSKLVMKKLVLRTPDNLYVHLWRHAMESPSS